MRTFAAPLRAGVSKPIAPRAAGGSRLRLKREHGAYRGRCFRSRSTARALRSGTRRAAQQCTRRARGVRAAPEAAWQRRPLTGMGVAEAAQPAAKRKPPGGCTEAAAALRHAGEVSRVNHGMSLGAILHSREGNSLGYPQPPCTDGSSSPSPDDSLTTKARTAPCDVGRAGLKVFPGDRYQIRAHPEHVIRLTPLFSIPALFEKARNLIPNAANGISYGSRTRSLPG